MGRIEKSIEIRAPPEKVWETLALDRLLEWEEGWKGELKSVEYTSEVRTPKDKLRVGASAHGTSKKNGGFDFEITESLENEKMAYRFLFGKSARVLVTYILEPIEEGTKFTYIVNYEPLSILWKIIGKLIPVLFSRGYERYVKNFKSILEK